MNMNIWKTKAGNFAWREEFDEQEDQESNIEELNSLHPQFRPFDTTNLLAADEIRREFTKMQCCSKNCMETIIKMRTLIH
jgi:hypothetical protein